MSGMCMKSKLTIGVDGCGFDPSTPGKGMGLKNIASAPGCSAVN